MGDRSMHVAAEARRILSAAGLFALALGLGACAKKMTQVDRSYVTPEGRPSAEAMMVLWYDQPNHVKEYKDNPPPGQDPGDELVREFDLQRQPAGTIDGLIFDGTPANEYQILRRESGGGFRRFQDFSAARTREWLDSKFELYRFGDPAPSTYSPPSYIGRGTLAGLVSRESPLSNNAELAAPAVDDIAYTGSPLPADSLFTLKWAAVPNAAAYWLQVYTFRNSLRSVHEKILSGTPAPLYDGLSTDILVARVDPPSTQYRIGDSTRTDVKILVSRETLFGVTYNVRVSAVDASGQMIACTRGDLGQVSLSDVTYGLFRLGVVQVVPSHPVLPGAAAKSNR